MSILNIVCSLVFFLCSLQASLGVDSKEVVSITGKDAVLKCKWIWDFKPDMGVMVFINGKRVGYWRRQASFKRVSHPLVEKRKIVVEPVPELRRFEVTVTVPKVQVSDDSLLLTCGAYGDDGLGALMSEQKIKLRVVDPPKIVTAFATEMSRIRDSKASLIVDCNVTGNPAPSVSWKRTDGVAISQGPTGPIRQKTLKAGSSQRLILAGPIRDEQDGTYVCEAAPPTKYVGFDGVKTASRKLKFSVTYKPTLIFEKIVHTDLGIKETLKIEAIGNPKPTVSCEVLTLPEPKLIRFVPKADHRVVYEVTIETVQPKDIRKYTCNATNDIGSVSDTVTLTMNPSVPKILSGNSTIYSDYYQLHWEVKSKAPISNVSVEVHVRNNDKNAKNRTRLVRTDVFNLEGKDRSFRHHIANLTQDTVHELRLRACNSRGLCSPQVASASFKTQDYDGQNTVNPAILVKAITEAPTGASRHNRCPDLAPAFLTPVFAAVCGAVLNLRL